MSIFDIIMVLLEVIVVILIAYEVYPQWRKRRSNRIRCEICDEIVKSRRRTKDTKLLACKYCRETYNKANSQGTQND